MRLAGYAQSRAHDLDVVSSGSIVMSCIEVLPDLAIGFDIAMVLSVVCTKSKS